MGRGDKLKYTALGESSNSSTHDSSDVTPAPSSRRNHRASKEVIGNSTAAATTGSLAAPPPPPPPPPSSSFQFSSFPASLPRIHPHTNRTPLTLSGITPSAQKSHVDRGIFSVMEEHDGPKIDDHDLHDTTIPDPNSAQINKTLTRNSSIYRHRTRRWQSHYHLRPNTSSSSSSTCSSSNNNDTWLSPLARRKEGLVDGETALLDTPIAEEALHDYDTQGTLSQSPTWNSPPFMHAKLFHHHDLDTDPMDLQEQDALELEETPEQTWLHESKITRAFTPYRQKNHLNINDETYAFMQDSNKLNSPLNPLKYSRNQEADIHLHFETQYSPIPTIAEDTVRDIPMSKSCQHDSLTGDDTPPHLSLHRHSERNTITDLPTDEELHNKSLLDTSFMSHHSDASSTATSKLRKNTRPMPDMSAFDIGLSEITTTSSVQSTDATHNQISILTDGAVGGEKRFNTLGSRTNSTNTNGPTRWLCPPTPVRTPFWAKDGHNIHKSDSLITTKVLATCPQHILDGLSSLENSFMEEGDTRSAGESMGSDSLHTHGESSHSVRDKSLMVSFATVMEEEEADISSNSLKSQQTRHGMDYTTREDRSFTLSKRRHMSPLDDPFHKDEDDFLNLSHSSKQIKSEKGVTSDSIVEDDSDRHMTYSSKSDPVGPTISFHTDFDILTQLGSGSFADVFKARYRGDGNIYAVKKSRRRFRGKRDRDRALSEVQIMQQLQNIDTKTSGGFKNFFCVYLLFFIRAWQEEGHFYCQTELCCRDSCRHLLQSITSDWEASSRVYPSLIENLNLRNHTDDWMNVPDHYHGIPESTLWKIGHDIAAGLSYIHSHDIVHLDIKPDNIFFVSHLRLGAICKIGDFGLARHVESMGEGEEGDTAYMASELLLLSDLKYPKKCDIFSLGLTLYELACGNFELPLEGLRWHDLRTGDHVPILPSNRSQPLKDMIKCMISKASDRPSAEMVLGHIKVAEAGSSYDKFLHDYIRDIEMADTEKQKRLSEIHLDSRYTPTHFVRRSSHVSDHTATPR